MKSFGAEVSRKAATQGLTNEGCKWQIEGTPEPGIYPITVIKRNWYLDKGRKYPQLAVQRLQLPLALGAGKYTYTDRQYTYVYNDSHLDAIEISSIKVWNM